MRHTLSRRLFGCMILLVAVAAPVLVATPAAAVPGLVVVSAESSTDLGGFKSASVYCPGGTKLVGGGGDVVGGGDSVHLYAVKPIDNDPIVDSFTASATEHDITYSAEWSVLVWAICASGVTGQVIVEASGADLWNETYDHATVYCPAGKKVIGAGGMVYKHLFILDSIAIGPNLDYVTVEGFRSEYYTGNGGMGLHAYAICVDPVPGLQRVVASSGYTSQNKTLSVGCPAGTRLHGTGASMTGAAGQAFFEALAPWGTYGVILSAREDTSGHTGTWNADLYAICAP